jgi:hypothetical protein
MYRSSLLGRVLCFAFGFLRYDWHDLGLLYPPLMTDTKLGRLVWRVCFSYLFMIPLASWGLRVLSGVLMNNWEGHGHVFRD